MKNTEQKPPEPGGVTPNTESGDAPKPRRATDEARATTADEAGGKLSRSTETRPPVPEEQREDDAVIARVGRLERDVGWVLLTAGVIGMIVPGILGTPFFLLGAFALWPGNRKHVEKWRRGHSPKFFHGSMKQINRFLDDLERRYPRAGKG